MKVEEKGGVRIPMGVESPMYESEARVCATGQSMETGSRWRCADIYETKGRGLEETCMKMEECM